MRYTPNTPYVIAGSMLKSPAMRRRMRNEVLKRDFYEFFKDSWHVYDPAPLDDGWHLQVLCNHAQAVIERKIIESVCCVPPAHCKSSIYSVALGAWAWTREPSMALLCGSYDGDLATRDSVKTRRLVESDWYQERFPNVRLRRDQNQKTYYETTAGGHRQITTPDSKTTGLRGDILTMDDAHNVKEAESDVIREGTVRWWFESMSSRKRDVRSGVKLVIGQRTHSADLPGECMKRKYYKLVLPAQFEIDHPDRSPLDPRVIDGEWLWPGRFPPVEMMKLMTEVGDYAWASQYQQRPTSRIGGMFARGNFTIIDAIPLDEPIDWVRAWDLAASTKKTQKSDPDYTVGVKIGRARRSGLLYVSDVQRVRYQAVMVEKLMRAIASQDGDECRIRIPQDPGQAGKAQSEYIIRSILQGFTVVAEIESGDKATKATPYAAQCQAGNVRILKAPWNEEFITEHAGFPNYDHDDIVDAVASGFRMLVGQTNTGMLDFLREEFERKQAEQVAEQAGAIAALNGGAHA